MDIKTVYGDRVMITDLQPYKANKESTLEVIEYGGSLMTGRVARVGDDCKTTEQDQRVLLQYPVGLEVTVNTIKYLIVRELDIIFTFEETEKIEPAVA